ncbi:MAG: DedA family protein [Phycisphaerales bacterium]|nr:DedA family protein [Phycisphaerales bacterium]
MTLPIAAADMYLMASTLRDVLSEDSWVAEMVRTYGHLFLFVGTFLEGESVVLAGGFAAQREWLSLPGVYLVCFIGSFAGDQFWYYLGRWKGGWVLDRFPKFKGNFAKVRTWLGRGEDVAVVASRFVPGTRMATPLLLGSSGYAPWRFAVFNAIGAAIWSLGLASIGYSIGKAVESVGIERKFQLYILLGLALFGLTWWLVSSAFRRTAAAAKAKIAQRHERQAHAGEAHPGEAQSAEPKGNDAALGSSSSASGGSSVSGAAGATPEHHAAPKVSIPSSGEHSVHAGDEHGTHASG